MIDILRNVKSVINTVEEWVPILLISSSKKYFRIAQTISSLVFLNLVHFKMCGLQLHNYQASMWMWDKATLYTEDHWICISIYIYMYISFLFWMIKIKCSCVCGCDFFLRSIIDLLIPSLILWRLEKWDRIRDRQGEKSLTLLERKRENSTFPLPAQRL